MKHFSVLALTMASGLALSAAAQTPASAPKVATIAFEDAVSQTNEGLRDFADLKKKFQPQQDQIQARGKQIDTLARQLQAQSATLSASERQSRAADLDNKRKQLELDLNNARKDFRAEVQDDYNALAPKVYDVLSDYARQHGYTVVLDTAQQNNPVLYAAKPIDITRQVISAYNAKSGVPAPVGGPPAVPVPRPTAAPHGR